MATTTRLVTVEEFRNLPEGNDVYWVVDPRLRQVRISTRDARTITWRSSQRIPLSLFWDATLAVDDIFG